MSLVLSQERETLLTLTSGGSDKARWSEVEPVSGASPDLWCCMLYKLQVILDPEHTSFITPSLGSHSNLSTPSPRLYSSFFKHSNEPYLFSQIQSDIKMYSLNHFFESTFK